MWLFVSLSAWAADPFEGYELQIPTGARATPPAEARPAVAPVPDAEVAPTSASEPRREVLSREFLESIRVAPRPARVRSNVDLPPPDAPKRWLYFRGWLPREHAACPDGRFRYTWNMASFRSSSPGPVVFDGVVLDRVR